MSAASAVSGAQSQNLFPVENQQVRPVVLGPGIHIGLQDKKPMERSQSTPIHGRVLILVKECEQQT